MKGPDRVALLLALSWVLFILVTFMPLLFGHRYAMGDTAINGWRDVMLVVIGALSGYISRGRIDRDE